MNILIILVPVSLTLGIAGLLTFLWMLRNHQYEDLDGDAWRIQFDDEIIPTPDIAAKAPLDKA
ncbi:MAG: cbb3-type cytochrome oxidase maturation protein [Yoonia sp.]|jgi:cbb3-type cytochrome oxidase maturation protein